MLSNDDQGLGELVERALTSVGLTAARVEGWLGAECGCEERKQKLNQLGYWARRIIKGRVEHAIEFLNRITDANG